MPSSGQRPARQTRYARAHDLDSWKADQRIAERGFAHRWDSVVADRNGEDFFLDLLDQHLSSGLDVLDVGCGHGELALSVAQRAWSRRAWSRRAWSRRALPLPDRCVDLVIDRRGPTLSTYLDDLRRVARPGAVVIGMHPAGTAPPPPWAASLPSLRHRFQLLGYDEVASWVTGPLARHGIADYRLWWIDVPEYLYSARSLYDRLAGDTVPPWESVAAEAEAAFANNQADGALVLRHVCLVWTARLP